MNAMGLRTAIASALLLLTTVPVSAEQARAISDVNMRSGPGSGYGRIDTLPADERVELIECASGWCRIAWNGQEGWVAERFLEPMAAEPGDLTEPPPATGADLTDAQPAPQAVLPVPTMVPPPVFVPQPTPVPTPVPAGPRACFHQGTDFTGEFFCAEPGEVGEIMTPGWENAVSSIRLEGGATAYVCREPRLGPSCLNVEENRATLGSFNDDISSWRVE